VRTVDETGRQEKRQYTDALGRLARVDTQEVNPTGPLMRVDYTYDLLDRLVQVDRDPGGANESVTTMAYDGLGRKSDMVDPDTGHWTYSYDAAGNLIEQQDALYLAGGHDDHDIFFPLRQHEPAAGQVLRRDPQHEQHRRRGLLLRRCDGRRRHRPELGPAAGGRGEPPGLNGAPTPT